MRRSNLTLDLDLSYSSPSPSPSPSIVPRKSPLEVEAQVVEVHEDNKKQPPQVAEIDT